MNDINAENDANVQRRNTRSLTIGQLVESVTKLTGQRCTPAMIYNYEKQGLIPEPKRTDGGFRLFSVDDVQRVVCIKRWQMQDLSLAEIKERMENCQDEFDIDENIPELPIDKRSQILDAAEVVFPQKGYASTTLQDIADEAGISSSSIYQHFDSKEELFLALTDNLNFVDILELDRINEALKPKEETSYEDVRQALIAVAQGFSDTHTRKAEIIRMFIAEAGKFPEVGERYCRRLIAPVEDMLEQYLSRQMDRGVIRKVDVKLAVHAFYGIFLNFIVTQQLLRGEGILYFPKENRISKLVDIYLNSLLETSAS